MRLLLLQWRTVLHRLDTVRPFQFASVALQAEAAAQGLDPDNPDGVAGACCCCPGLPTAPSCVVDSDSMSCIGSHPLQPACDCALCTLSPPPRPLPAPDPPPLLQTSWSARCSPSSTRRSASARSAPPSCRSCACGSTTPASPPSTRSALARSLWARWQTRTTSCSGRRRRRGVRRCCAAGGGVGVCMGGWNHMCVESSVDVGVGWGRTLRLWHHAQPKHMPD